MTAEDVLDKTDAADGPAAVRDRKRGSLLGLAMGDDLGADVESRLTTHGSRQCNRHAPR